MESGGGAWREGVSGPSPGLGLAESSRPSTAVDPRLEAEESIPSTSPWLFRVVDHLFRRRFTAASRSTDRRVVLVIVMPAVVAARG
jgi:hypothetical protein